MEMEDQVHLCWFRKGEQQFFLHIQNPLRYDNLLSRIANHEHVALWPYGSESAGEFGKFYASKQALWTRLQGFRIPIGSPLHASTYYDIIFQKKYFTFFRETLIWQFLGGWPQE